MYTVHTPPRKAAFTSEEDELDSINKMASDVSLNDMPSADANTAARCVCVFLVVKHLTNTIIPLP